jgi:hypothetical protein
MAGATKEQLRQREWDRERRWIEGLGLFSKLSEFDSTADVAA